MRKECYFRDRMKMEYAIAHPVIALFDWVSYGVQGVCPCVGGRPHTLYRTRVKTAICSGAEPTALRLDQSLQDPSLLSWADANC